ncbi:hypothetical protein D3C87_1381200 [compost metagenome]
MVVQGPLAAGHPVDRQGPEALLGQLLQEGLGVLGAGRRGGHHQLGLEQLADERRDDLEPEGEVHRGKDRLERGRDVADLLAAAGALLGLAEAHVAGQVQAAGDRRQGGVRDDPRADLGHLALGELPEALVDPGGGDQLEHRVAQKLEPLVVGVAREGGVGQGLLEEVLAPHRQAEDLRDEFDDRLAHAKRRKTRLALWPPKPMLLVMQTSTSAWRAAFGT